MYRKLITGENLSFLILDRQLVTKITPDTDYAVISITDPNLSEARLGRSDKLKGVLRVKFSDAVDANKKHGCFQAKDARKILKFVLEQRAAKVDTFVIHCETDGSRASAVACALALLVGDSTATIEKYYKPNTFVRDLLLSEREKGSCGLIIVTDEPNKCSAAMWQSLQPMATVRQSFEEATSATFAQYGEALQRLAEV
jgi:predicted protein tyrosine phosphatase